MQVIYSRLEADFGSEAEAWDLRARRWLSSHPPAGEADTEEAAIAVFQEALAATEGPQMYDLYLESLEQQLEAWVEASGADPDGPLLKLKGRAKALIKQILQVNSLPTCPRQNPRPSRSVSSVQVLAKICVLEVSVESSRHCSLKSRVGTQRNVLTRMPHGL